MARSKNQKQCIICGKMFECPPSDKTVTCSPECRREYAKIRMTDRKHSDETRQKMSDAANGRDMSGIQKIGTAAALRSPNSREFHNIRAGLCNAKIAASGRGKYRCCTYRGWRCLPVEPADHP